VYLYAICIFRKMYTQCTMGWGLGRTLEAGEFSWIFVLKVTLWSVGLLLTVSYRRTGGARCTSCSPNNFAGGATASPAPPVPTHGRRHEATCSLGQRSRKKCLFASKNLKKHPFLARDSIYAIARYMPSPVHLSVCHTGGSVKDGWS